MMTLAVYGQSQQTLAEDALSQHLEALRLRGYTIVHDLFTPVQLQQWRDKADAVYAQQEKAFGADALDAIGERDTCRAPLLYDFDFTAFADHPRVLEIVRGMIGQWVVLNLQNVIINRPDRAHHQRAWHRDLPHQNFVISTPLAINALYALDDFTSATGGTQLLPFSHKEAILPSNHYIEQNHILAQMPAGSAILFDAMLFHRAGENTSGQIRRGVNQLYTVPIIKQQYDFPRALAGRSMSTELARLLGTDSQVPVNDVSWRQARAARLGGKR